MVGVEPLQAIARKCEPGNTSVQLGSSVWRWGAGGGWAEAEGGGASKQTEGPRG